MGSSNFEDIKFAITTLKNNLCDKNVVEELEWFQETRKNKIIFQFFEMKYKDMVTILFEFINSLRSRNWLARLNDLEEIIPYVTTMDTIKYPKCYQFIYQICKYQRKATQIYGSSY